MTHLQMDQDKPAQGQNSSGNSGLQNGVSNVPAVNPSMISPAASPTNVSFKSKLVNFDQNIIFSKFTEYFSSIHLLNTHWNEKIKS